MKTLHLNLKKQWFDMILAGEKKQEYREIKPYYIRMLIDNRNNYSMDFACRILMSFGIGSQFMPKHYDTITFSNGYAKDRRQLEIELKSIEIGIGKTEWGAVGNKLYFVLNLGEILKSK